MFLLFLSVIKRVGAAASPSPDRLAPVFSIRTRAPLFFRLRSGARFKFLPTVSRHILPLLRFQCNTLCVAVCRHSLTFDLFNSFVFHSSAFFFFSSNIVFLTHDRIPTLIDSIKFVMKHRTQVDVYNIQRVWFFFCVLLFLWFHGFFLSLYLLLTSFQSLGTLYGERT